MTREACIVAAGQFGDSYCLFKNRDRNYIPEVNLYHEVLEGVEVAYLYDDKTGWIEGMNEFGVGIVNAALMVSRDESERDEVERTGKKLSDGDRILRALQEKTVAAAAKSIQTYKGGLKGHTIISDGKTTMYVEHPKDDQESHGKVSKGEVFVRTNHGIDFPDAGYVEGPREESSKKRQSQAEEILGAVKSAEDVAPAILRAREDRYEPTEMVRDHKNEKKMRTTSQMVMDLTHKKIILYLLPGKVKWLGLTDKMPKGRESLIEIEVVEYESLSVGTEGKVKKKKASGLLPILDPAFNLREIFKQLVLLEDHLFQSRKRCLDCIWKHLLTAEALAEEALTLDENHKYTKLIEDTVVRIRSLQNALQDARPYDEIAQSARNIRKGLLPIASNVRVATRAIPIDRSKVNALIQRIYRKLLATELDPNLPLGEHKRSIVDDAITITDVLGDEQYVKVSVFSSLSRRPDFVLSGGFGHHKTKHTPQIVVMLNGKYTLDALTNPKVSQDQFLQVLAHEITHASDIVVPKINPIQGRIPNTSEVDLLQYYNNPHEVRAHMRELYEEVSGVVHKVMQTSLGKDWGLGGTITRMLQHRENWVDMQPYLSRENKNKILKGLVTMFEDDMSEMHTTAHKVATQWLTSSRYKCVPEGMVLLDYVRGYKQISGIKRIPIAQVTEDHQTRIVVGLEDIVEQDLLIKGKPYMSTQKMEALFSDEVVIEEKVDGHPMVAIYQGYTFFCESLKVQHSVDYDACPYSQDGWPDMLVVYEIMDGEHSPPYSEGGGTGKWLSRNDKEAVCHMVGAPICPLVFQGRVDPEDVPALAQRLSSFGSSQAEGVVLKNLKKGIFGKFVNVEFQKRITDEDMWGGVHPEQRGLKNVRRTASGYRTELLSANQLRDRIQSVEKTNVPYLDTDDFDLFFKDIDNRGKYIVVSTQNGVVVGIRKFYEWSKTKEHANAWLLEEGLPVITGRFFTSAYVAVHPDYQRQGVATLMNNYLASLLQAGDVFMLGSHTNEGKALNRKWLQIAQGNVLYGPHYRAFEQYDPDQVNFLVSDTESFMKSGSVRRVAQQYLSAAAKYKDKKQVPKADGSGKTTVYVYSERQVQNRNRDKAERVDSLRHSIEDLRKQVGKDIDSEDTKTRLTALAVALIDATFERVGNEDSADDGHFGVTGWLKKHVSFSKGKATITYVGKSGVSHKKEVSDKKLVSALRGCCEDKKPDDTILSFGADDSEGAVKITSREVNTYLKPFDVTAKDLRGFHANRTMQDNLKAARKKGPKLPTSRKEKDKILKKEFKEALEATAEAVGHEPATLRTQYLVPGLEDTYMKDGTVSETLKDAAQRVAAQWLHATLSPAEKEDREYDRMIRKSPKKKPPRHDKRRTLVKDPTEKEEPQDKDQSKNCKDVGGC